MFLTLCQVLDTQTKSCEREIYFLGFLQGLALCTCFCDTLASRQINQVELSLLLTTVWILLQVFNHKDGVAARTPLVLIGGSNLSALLPNL